MTVYHISPNGNRFQSLAPADHSLIKRRKLVFDCESREENWTSPELYIFNPKGTRGRFFSFAGASGTLVCDDATTDIDIMYDLLTQSSELLPLDLDGEPLWAINVLECVNALDRNRTVWPEGLEKQKIGIPNKFVFHPERVSDMPLFKIPETSMVHILCATGIDQDRDFKAAYERFGLTGLRFLKLWSDEDE